MKYRLCMSALNDCSSFLFCFIQRRTNHYVGVGAGVGVHARLHVRMRMRRHTPACVRSNGARVLVFMRACSCVCARVQTYCPENGPRNSKRMWLIIGLLTMTSPVLISLTEVASFHEPHIPVLIRCTEAPSPYHHFPGTSLTRAGCCREGRGNCSALHCLDRSLHNSTG